MKSKSLKPIFFTLITTGLIFNIKFKGLPPTFFIAAAILACIALYYLVKKQFISTNFLKLSLLYILFLSSVFISLINNTDIWDIFLIQISLAIFFVSVIVPYAYASYFESREYLILRYIALAGIINSFL